MSDCISRQEALDEWNRLSERGRTEFDQVLMMLPSTESEQRWIPCSERLPELEKKSYWVCTDDGYQCECRWTNVNVLWTNLTTDWHWNIFDLPQYCKVAAWMPLPEPYEGRWFE